jgi:ubiquinone/menaquinone biosynthesis C-methylase UbiE
MSTVTNDRWSKAQAYEAEWWDTRRHDMELEYYKNYADDIKERVRPFITLEHATHILEVGSGAAGIITHFTECDFRYAIDPLEDFYASIPEFAAYRDKRVEYMTAMGEHLAFRDGFFDLVIMDNVLDHCKEPDRVMGEIHRVMKSGGIVFFRQNIYHLWGSSCDRSWRLPRSIAVTRTRSPAGRYGNYCAINDFKFLPSIIPVTGKHGKGDRFEKYEGSREGIIVRYAQ